MIKKFIAVIIVIFSITTFAQQNTASPYSFFGLGDIKSRGTVEQRSMGGLSIIPDSIHINLQNPALLSGIKLTSFAVGGTSNSTNFQTTTQSEKNNRFSLDYLSIALPYNKLGIAFGLVPFSAVGYKVQSISTENNQLRRFEGNGGINRVYTTFSYQLTKNLSIGADLQYNFGLIETKNLYSQVAVELSSREMNTTNVKGFSLNSAIAYQSKISKKLSLFSSLIYAPQTSLTLSNSRNLSTIYFNSIGNEVVIDNLDLNPQDTKLKLPTKITMGVAIGEVRKWIVGTEFTHADNSNFGNRFNDIQNTNFQAGTKFTLGGYYIPKFNSYNSYLKRVTYRAGLRLENTGLQINGQTINDNAATLGLSLPLGGAFSSLNLGFEYGTRGTTNSGLVKENYTNLSIGLSFSDRWFQKRKFD